MTKKMNEMKSRISIYVAGLMITTLILAQVPRPADPQTQPIAILNAVIHIGDGTVIASGFVTFKDGKIEQVGSMSATRPDFSGYERIEAAGKHVYPSLIMPATRLGLEDFSSIRATRDFQEVGSITPHVRSQIAFNTDSDIFPTMRFNGVLLAQVVPQGGLVSGTSSVMTLDAWNWEDATYLKDDGIHINWPAKTDGPRWWMGETEKRPNPQYSEQVAEILDLVRDAKAYKEQSPKKTNLPLEAMKGVLDGTQRVFIYANDARSIMESVTKLADAGLKNLVIVGGSDAWYVKDLLKEYEVAVILDNIHRLPSRTEEPVDFPYELPSLLHKEGILVGLRHDGMLARGRNLPFYAGTAAIYNISKEDALKMITSNTAKILGIDHKTGTIEKGKDANLLLVEGDLLDMRSSIITKAFLQGRDVIIEHKQQVLYERYKEKYSEK